MAGGDAEARLVLKGVDDNALTMIRKAKAETKGLVGEWKEMHKATLESNVAFIKGSDALRQISHGLNMAGNSMETLGLLTKEQAQAMNTALAIMNLFVGAAMAIRGVIGLIDSLRVSTTALAIVEALRTGLIPVIGPILVAAAIAAAMGAAIFLATAQTAPGERRTVTKTGPIYAHEGETIGRVSPPEKAPPEKTSTEKTLIERMMAPRAPSEGGGAGGISVVINAPGLNIGSYYDRRALAKQIRRAIG